MDKKTLKWIYKNTKFCIPSVIVLTLANILFALISLVMIVLTKEIIDFAVIKDYENVTSFAVYFIVLVVFSLFFRILFRNFEERLRVKMDIKMKTRFMEKSISRDYREISAYHSGDLQSRMFSDVSVVVGSVMTIIPDIAEMLTGILGAFVLLASTSVSFAVFFVLAGILLLLGSAFFKNVIKKYHKEVQKKDAKVRSFVLEVFSNILAVKVFNNKNTVEDKSKKLLKEYKKARIKRASFSIFMSSSVAFVFELGYAYALLWGAVNLVNGIISYGTLAAALQLVGKIQGPLAGLSYVGPEIFKAMASAERLMEIENLSSHGNVKEFKEKDWKKIKSIEFKNVTFAYENENVLENVSFILDKNSFVAITGQSGIGKSTLLKLLLGVYKPDDGEIFINTEKEKISVKSLVKGLFTYVPQGNMLFSGTVRENICFITDNVNEEDFRKAAKIALVDDFVNTLPDGYETLIGEKGLGISEGQVQRIAMARAILSGNKFILLDEATSALDEETEKKLLENLKGLENVTVITVTHKKAALDICDKHFVFEGKNVYEEKCINE